MALTSTPRAQFDVTGNEHALIISEQHATHVFNVSNVEIRTISEFSDQPTSVEVVFRASRFDTHSRGVVA
ncbi:hypothetical protein [Nocardia terpenica]|uniref:Uncharacterized protein n=1 Tax=Nocardia terpenica TaxID=455432 RepID=A0A164LD75_9NOCA|nr:hypothetical protein [Nocardia terpenica]KZM72279.1 hypothetical protein AWN90_37010 [Nocardia terpenica]NQE86576.1 hypothetical protein [Nocardia terpenica]